MTPDLYDLPVRTASGETATLADYRDRLLLVVNTASRCGLTVQYDDLRELDLAYQDRGLSVVAFPCNQFGGQEPGSAEEIQQFCSLTFGIDFPVFDKVDVNGPDAHPLFRRLSEVPDADGVAGAVQWNFEKFLIGPQESSLTRIRPKVRPSSPEFTALVEQKLPQTAEAHQ